MLLDVVRAPDTPADLTFLAPLAGFAVFAMMVLAARWWQVRQRLARARDERVVRTFNSPIGERFAPGTVSARAFPERSRF